MSATPIPHPSAPLIEEREVLELLTTLVDKSLVFYDEKERRYRLMESVRHYAGDRLFEAGDGIAYRGRHRDWFLGLAEKAEKELFGPDQAAWFDRLETEHDNLRASLRFAVDGSWLMVDGGSSLPSTLNHQPSTINHVTSVRRALALLAGAGPFPGGPGVHGGSVGVFRGAGADRLASQGTECQ